MNSIIPLQNSPERVSLLPIAPGVDFATAVALRRMATSTGATPAYLLAPEVSALLWYMPDQRHHMLFATMWNTGIRIGEARTLTPESFDWMVCALLFGCCRKKCGHVVAGRQKMKCVWYR